jgi:hypothetical protein
VADVESGPQPLQERGQFRGFEPDIHGHRNGPDVKAGVKSNSEFGPVRYVEDDPIAGSDAAVAQSARHAPGLVREPRIGPPVITISEGYAIRIVRDLMIQCC